MPEEELGLRHEFKKLIEVVYQDLKSFFQKNHQKLQTSILILNSKIEKMILFLMFSK